MPQSNKPNPQEIQNNPINGIEDELRSLLQILEKDLKPQKEVVETIVKLTAYRGAWPPAEVIKEQEAALPGSGKRLLRWTEEQASHRQSLERMQVEGNERRMDRGQYFSLFIGLSCLACGTYLVASLNDVFGAFAGIAIVAIGVVTPTAMLIARGIRHLLGSSDTRNQQDS